MAQGYPPPQQYGQNPYAQPQSPPQAYPVQGYPPQGYPANPYGQQPPAPQQYQQPQQPQQPYQQPPQQYGQNPYPAHGQNPYPAHGQNPYPAHGQPAQQPQVAQPQAAQPYAAHGQGFDAATAAPTPPETSNYRRFPAILIDFLVAVGPAVAVADKAGHVSKSGIPWIVGLLGTGLVLSFVNQVLLTRLTGFSVGKGVMALRVIRRKRVMHPNTWRLTRRWLIGFVVLLISWLTEEFEGEGDIVGVRIVRWKHLREYEQATGRLG
ncbi:RDD family protein [Kitasatospora sp. NPDC093558]|uniref:RDD family protein n=1 Tax=Kitasatospora sp. NPDC093558 TaxID=3155201 RepID=UPI00341C82E0